MKNILIKNCKGIIITYKKLVDTSLILFNIKKEMKCTKENYNKIMELCNNTLKLSVDIQKLVENMYEEIEEFDFEGKTYLQQTLTQCPIEELIDKVLDCKNEVKDKFIAKKHELSNMDQYRRQYLFYMGFEDPSIMELEI
jgi:hypothetical protein